MKKIIYIILIAMYITMFFGGCGNNDEVEPESFILSQETQEEYTTLINETLNNFYWYYDANSFAYFESTVPANTEENNKIFVASMASGYNLRTLSQRNCVVYTVDLTHFNGNKGGTAYFYFVSDKIVGAYYVNSDDVNNVHSLSFRNVFIGAAKFAKYEDVTKTPENRVVKSTNIPDGFISESVNSVGDKVYLSLDETSLRIYRFVNSYFVLDEVIDINSLTGYHPVSATFYDGNKIGILVGTVVEAEHETESELNRLISEKVVFLNENYKITSDEIILNSSGYSCISKIDNKILLINDKNIEIYEKTEEGFKIAESYYTNVHGTYFVETDMDNDGVAEYIITDDKDLYVYRKVGINLNCIWKTNISVESFSGGIYVGDTNNDGAKEIYISDMWDTIIRYILTPEGIISSNEDIFYGEKIYASDFNNDGIDDYIKISGESGSVKEVYLGE